MELDDPVLFLHERKCRVCGKTYPLTEGFYLSRKSRGEKPSSYSYECKTCTIARVKKSKNKINNKWEYPDW